MSFGRKGGEGGGADGEYVEKRREQLIVHEVRVFLHGWPRYFDKGSSGFFSLCFLAATRFSHEAS